MSNTTKHTPGPWEAVQVGNRAVVIDEKFGLPISEFYDRTNGQFHNEAYANAMVSAAAPEMLEALVQAKAEIIELLAGESCDHSVGICYCKTNNRLLMIEEAIKKAQP